MSYPCEVKEQPAQFVLSMRTRTAVQDLPQFFGKAYGAIMAYLGELGQHPAGPPFAAYYNMDMQDLDTEAGFPVAARLPGRGEIQAGEIPAGRVATSLYVGPYSEVGPAWEALSQWTQDNGHEPTGVAYEWYLNDPSETAPQELRTQIILPLK